MSGPASPPPEGPGAEALRAALNVQRLAGLRRQHILWAAAASVPVWLDALWPAFPGALGWLGVLAQGVCVALAVADWLLEERWQRRAERLGPARAQVEVHRPPSPWDDLRPALWAGLSVVSLVPWAYVASGRAWPAGLLGGVTAAAVATFVLVVFLESAATFLPSRGRAVPGRED